MFKLLCCDLTCGASIFLPLFFHRAFGEKSAPPAIPVTDPSVQAEADLDGEESGEEGAEDLAQESEGQNDSGTATVESSCPNLQDLSLREGEKEEETEEVQQEQEDSRSPQGKFSQSASEPGLTLLDLTQTF